MSLLTNQFGIYTFRLTFALTGVHFRGGLKYVGNVG